MKHHSTFALPPRCPVLKSPSDTKLDGSIVNTHMCIIDIYLIFPVLAFLYRLGSLFCSLSRRWIPPLVSIYFGSGPIGVQLLVYHNRLLIRGWPWFLWMTLLPSNLDPNDELWFPFRHPERWGCGSTFSSYLFLYGERRQSRYRIFLDVWIPSNPRFCLGTLGLGLVRRETH